MKKFLLLILLTLIGSIVLADTAVPIQITRIVDGDSLEAQINNNKFGVRLIGVDCYETCIIHRTFRQAYENNLSIDNVTLRGRQSKEFLEQLYQDNSSQDVLLRFYGVDKYGRALGVLYFGELNVNNELIERGGCMKYKYEP